MAVTPQAKEKDSETFQNGLGQEWLLTNGRGGFASGTVLGIPTRKYHGLLVAAARPPLHRWVLLSATLDRVGVSGRQYDMSSFQFERTIHPRGYDYLTDFAYEISAERSWVRFVYTHDGATLTKEIAMPNDRDEVVVRYRLQGPANEPLSLEIHPLTPMRDFHSVTRAFAGAYAVQELEGFVAVDAYADGPRLWMSAQRIDGASGGGDDQRNTSVDLCIASEEKHNDKPSKKRGKSAANVAKKNANTSSQLSKGATIPGQLPFVHHPDWWYGFHYSEDADRGVECNEDMFVPGCFRVEGRRSIEVMFRAVGAFGDAMHEVPAPAVSLASLFPASDEITPPISSPQASTQRTHKTLVDASSPKEIERRLFDAARAFVVARSRDDGSSLPTILAGYPWFGDWGRDIFVSLPGLLLETHRYAEARHVLEIFASAEKDGLIPNRFSDFGDGRDYNAADTSLWFIHAADAYCQASSNDAAWAKVFAPVCERIIGAYARGTQFNIRCDIDGLITCGDANTQLTWMDAKCNGIVFTPRHGKPVEINALWYHDLCLMARRMENIDARRAAGYRDMAERARAAFLPTFWNEKAGCLYDVVRDNWRDLAIRPNQILAVSLPDSPLDAKYQRAVLDMVQRELLTPYGLRSLSPQHPSFTGHYRGTPFERDSVYHQGTVWAWLMGPYVEAYLRVHQFSNDAKRKMRDTLMPLVRHFDEAGLGYVSEIFDGNAPHKPRGCIAQAWSVAELIRAWAMCQ